MSKTSYVALAMIGALLTVPMVVAGQTFVQLADLDPQNAVGPRLTRTVTQNKLSGKALFAHVTSKVTYVSAEGTQPIVYEFASDGVWNRVLFGQKDVYIRGFDNVSATTQRLLGPAGLDVSAGRIVYIGDRLNARVVLARFDPGPQTLTQVAVTSGDSVLQGVTDVAWDGGTQPFLNEYFYALSTRGIVSWWRWDHTGAPTRQWSYGSAGNGSGQFLNPQGVCVGRELGAGGGSVSNYDFYVTDAGNRRVVRLQRLPNGGALWVTTVTLPDSGVPTDCTVDHFGNVTIADSKNSRLLKYTYALTYLDQYGAFGLGATNSNTFAHPHAVHAPFGVRRNPSTGELVWYGEGRVITAEDWGAESGAREHYLGVNGSVTAQPQVDNQYGDAWFSYRTTDHGTHTSYVVDISGNYVRTTPYMGIYPPGTRMEYWDGLKDDGTPAPTGTYWFAVLVTSAYGCSGQSWCAKGLSTQTFYHVMGSGCGHPCSPPIAAGDSVSEPSALFLRQRVVGAGQPLARISASAAAAPGAAPTATPRSLTELVRAYGVRGLSFGVPRPGFAGPVLVRIHSLAGRPVRTLVNQTLEPGYYEVGWDGLDDHGRPAGPGVYFAVLAANGKRLVERLILRQE